MTRAHPGKEGTPEKDYADGYGLAKIAVKHPEVMDDLQGHISALSKESQSLNRIVLSGEKGRAIIRRTWDGVSKKWLLTAYGNEEMPPAASGRRTGVTDRAESAPPVDQVAGEPRSHEAKAATESIPQSESGRPSEAAAAIKNDGTLHQAATRGGFDPSRLAILLNDKADFSTFAHETAHYYLTVLSDLARDPGHLESKVRLQNQVNIAPAGPKGPGTVESAGGRQPELCV